MQLQLFYMNTYLNLTLTSVVFESDLTELSACSLQNLTLTSVVFEYENIYRIR